MQRRRWSPAEAARLGYLVARGEPVAADDPFLSRRSYSAARGAAARWGSIGCLFGLIPEELRLALVAAAQARGESPTATARAVLTAVLRDGLVESVIDDAPESYQHANATCAAGGRLAADAAVLTQIEREAAQIRMLMASGVDVIEAMRIIAQRRPPESGSAARLTNNSHFL
jgi:hypothetical protein